MEATTIKVPIGKIISSTDRKYGGEGNIETLAQSIEQHGLIHPLAVKENTEEKETIYFECRYCGMKLYPKHEELPQKEKCPVCGGLTLEEKETPVPVKLGGAAFPHMTGTHSVWAGMSLRNYFAGQALTGLMTLTPINIENAVGQAFRIANSMIAKIESMEGLNDPY